MKSSVLITGSRGFLGTHLSLALKEENYETFSLGDGVRAEAKKQNLEPTGKNLGKLMLELREKNGPGAVAELIKNSIHNSTHEVVIIDGIRSIAEIDVLKKFGKVKLLAIDASPQTRFNFLTLRGRSDDAKTREKNASIPSCPLGLCSPNKFT